ncbi:hypothetical protein EJD88_16360 [Pseudomonas sp. PB105]|nr:hypothetical protein EJD88_16360 [Pseudomonas sp. PB105]MVW98758.1 hypothetical protein [Pseudomonas sp. PB100]
MKERRRMRFIRMMKRNTGTREKMWAGHTAPFFCLRKSKCLPPECKKAPVKGAFSVGQRRFSALVAQFCWACHPIQRHPASDLCAR